MNHPATPGTVERIRDGIHSIVLPFHSRYPGSTLTYVVEAADGALTVIDPGWATEQNLALLTGALGRIGRSADDVSLVVVTHLHPDHIGLADRLRRASGATVALHRAEQRALHEGMPRTDVPPDWFAGWGVPSERWDELLRWWVQERRYPDVTADLLLDDGDRLPIAGHELSVLHTPGHTTGSICLLDEREHAIFTGDHLLPDAYPGIALGGRSARNPIAEYLDALDRLAPYDDLEALPGHGWRFRPLGERRERIAAHHRRRSDEVASALDRLTAPTIWRVAAELHWSGGWPAMRDYRLASALSQTELHVGLLERAGELSTGARNPRSDGASPE